MLRRLSAHTWTKPRRQSGAQTYAFNKVSFLVVTGGCNKPGDDDNGNFVLGSTFEVSAQDETLFELLDVKYYVDILYDGS